jgi:hypothetical protein
MELFIPSLIVIVLGGLVIFFILPRLTPYALGIMALVLFGVGVFQHYQTFPYEYSTGNFRDMLSDYSPFLMILATILALIVGVMVAFGGNPPAMPAMPEMPAIPNVSSIAAMPVSLPNIGVNMFGGNASTAKNGMMGYLGGNVKRNNVASTSFKVT